MAKGMAYKHADTNLKIAKANLAQARKAKADPAKIKELEKAVNNAQAVRNQF